MISGTVSSLAGLAMGGMGLMDAGMTAARYVSARTMIAAGAAALTSRATGGDVLQGALTGATVHLFNHEGNHAQKGRSTGGQMGRRQRYEQDSKLFQSADLSVDGQLCAGPCIGGELELSKAYDSSTTIKSGFGLKASGGVGSDINIINLGDSPQNGDISTINFLSGQLGPVGITVNHYSWPDGSQWSFELNFRFPGGLGVNGGTGLKKW